MEYNMKEVKDLVVKFLSRGNSARDELQDFFEYFKEFEPITFDYKKSNGIIIAKSRNFHYGSIITSGQNQKELDSNIKDAILTAFDIPYVYLEESRLHKLGDKKVAQYATA